MGYKWVTNGTIQYVIDSITKHVSGRDAEQELVSTVSRARRGTGTGTGISDLFTGQKKPLNQERLKDF